MRSIFARWPGDASRSISSLLLTLAFAVPAAEAFGGEWPQILGPHRNGVADGETLTPWTTAALPMVWSAEIGEGYAGPAVASGRVVVFHRVADAERAEAFDAATGRRLWQTDFPASYRGGIDPDTGPRCVPLIHRDRVYLFGAAGDLHCLSLAQGEKQWTRSTQADFRATEGYFGAGSTPVVAGGRLLVNVGGRDEAGLVAFDLETGRTLWKRTAESASYSSPTVATVAGQERAFFITRLNAMAVDPQDGSILFQLPFGQRGPTVNAATPLLFDDCLFLTANYGVGARLLRVRGTSAETVWANDESLSSQYPTPVHQAGFLYGMHGREDVGVAELRCVEAATGKARWSVPGFGMAHLIVADGKLLILSVQGRLHLIEASPERFRTLASADVSQAVTRALPALAGGRLYFRENDGQAGRLKCLALGTR